MVRIKRRYLLVEILYPPGPSHPYATKPARNPDLSGSDISSEAKDQNSSQQKSTLVNSATPVLAFHSPTPDGINIPTIIRLLRSELSDLFGDYGAGAAGASLSIMYWSNATSTMILRCDRAAFRLVWAACTAVKALPPTSQRTRAGTTRNTGFEGEKLTPCVFRVVHVSGTIRKCEQEAIRRAMALCGRVKGLSAVLEAGIKGDLDTEDDAEAIGQKGSLKLMDDDSVDVSDVIDVSDADDAMEE